MIDKINIDVWQQGNDRILVFDVAEINSKFTNVFQFRYTEGKNTQEECIDEIRKKINNIKGCAHIIESALVNGRQVSQCRFCKAETK